MAKIHRPGWRKIMPIYYDFEWEGFKVKAKPIGIRKVFKFLPYITGNKPTFKVIIDTISGEPRPLTTILEFFEPDDRVLGTGQELSNHERPVSKINKDIKVRKIGISGDHRFQISLWWEKKYSLGNDLITFRAIANETIIGWTVGTLIGIVLLLTTIALLIVGICNLILLT